MKEKKKNEEFHSRREFFKKALKGILPFLGAVMIVPSILSSCDDPDDDESYGGGGSSGGGSSSCSTCVGVERVVPLHVGGSRLIILLDVRELVKVRV